MSTEQKENLDAILREGPFAASADVNQQRRLLKAALSAQPIRADVTVTASALGGVRTAEITINGIEPRHVVLCFHGGVYVEGDALAAYEALLHNGTGPAAFVMSPYVDLTLAGATMEPKRAYLASAERVAV